VPGGSTATGLLQWGLITAVVLFILNVLFESNVQHFIEELGWDQFLTRAVRKMRPLSERKGFWFAFGLVAGGAIIAWLYPLLNTPSALRIRSSLSANNARLDIWKSERGFQNKTQVLVNLFVANHGQLAASDVRHLSIVPIGNGYPLGDSDLTAIFLMLHAQLAIPNPVTSKSEIYPGDDRSYFSAYSLKPITPSRAGGLKGNRQRRF
jgi:hypothetical protein